MLDEIKQIKKTDIGRKVDRKLKSFRSFERRSEDEWFSELCFCILTANAKAKTAIQIQKELGCDGFKNYSMSQVCDCIKENRHRFHNNKSSFIINARKNKYIKKTVKSLVKNGGELAAREWLAENIKGIGYKEASHFMRNVGYFNLAILDRHILRLMDENRIIKLPKSLTKKNYLMIERKFLKLAKKHNMSAGELDMYMWYMKTGAVLK